MGYLYFQTKNVDGEIREWNTTIDELLEEWNSPTADVPDLIDPIVVCVLDGINLYFDYFQDLMNALYGNGNY